MNCQSLFSGKKRAKKTFLNNFDISCKLSLGDNFLEMSKPIFWEK